MKYYLATTGLTDYWKMDKDILFLGPWCLSDEKKKDLLKVDKTYLTIPRPWKVANEIKTASDYCLVIYRRLLPSVVKNLNQLHQVNHSEGYWELTIGFWLYQFIDVLFERYCRIQNALELYPDFQTNVLPKQSGDLVSFDTRAFVAASGGDDYYNLKLFSLIINKFCADNSFVENFQVKQKENIKRFSFGKRWANVLLKIFRAFFEGPMLLFYMSSLTIFDKLLLQIKTHGRLIRFTDYKELEIIEKKSPRNDYCQTLRNHIVLTGAEDKFQELLCELIPSAIPLCFIENYKLYQTIINRIKGIETIKVVGSIAAFYYFEGIKFLTALLHERGAKVIEFQHGGSYGQALCNPPETLYEKERIFYHWGWAEKSENNYRLLPSAFLSKLRDSHQTKTEQILYISTNNPKYTYRLQCQLLPDDMSKYYSDIKIFLNSLAPNIRNRILFRPYFPDFGWNTIDKIKSDYPDTRFMIKGKTVDMMKKVKLVVIDHPISSMLEALVINVPCVFFWDHDVYLMRPEAEEYFKLMEDVGITHRDPQSAAKKIMEIYDDPLKWWMTDSVQAARKKFCEKYVYTSDDWLNLWIQELKQLAKT